MFQKYRDMFQKYRDNNQNNENNENSNHDSSGDFQREPNAHQGMMVSPQNVIAFVGEGVEFKGTINYQGTIKIDGQLEGEIHTEGTLIVGQSAVINAKVQAGTIVCQGKIVGDIVACEKIQLISPGVLDGSVQTPSLSMEEGVLFNGTCEMSAKSHHGALASRPEVAPDYEMG